MLVIRKAQMEVFRAERDRAFVHWLAQELRSGTPELVEGIDPQTLEPRLRAGMARARRHGVTTPMGIWDFVASMLRYAPNFDEHPAIAPLLSDASIEPAAKMEAVFARVPASVWAEVKAQSDAASWGDERAEESR
jgi:hypothetical protein